MHHSKSHPVALVPFNVDSSGNWMDLDNLLQVAAALNIQALRDLAPTWGVSAIVSPFSSLSQVPPTYDVIAVLPPQSNFTGPHGFHFRATDMSIAVVKYADDWSLFASHELMEMLVDRHGDRTASGPSLKDKQGRVDYLVEVCDPCQHSTYTIDGVLVSDFITPGYYGDPPASGHLYSFTGRITEPRTLLDGGYITWATQAPKQQVWQALAPAGTTAEPGVAALDPTKDMGPLTPARLTREWIDLHPPTTPAGAVRPGPNSALAGGQPLSDAQVAFQAASLAAIRNGQGLNALISEVVQSAETQIALDTSATSALLKQLATKGGQTKFQAAPAAALAPIAPAEELPDPVPAPTVLPPNERYTEALNAFKAADRFGTDLYKSDLPGLVVWMCQLGGF
jgi:hypothetical protein